MVFILPKNKIEEEKGREKAWQTDGEGFVYTRKDGLRVPAHPGATAHRGYPALGEADERLPRMVPPDIP